MRELRATQAQAPVHVGGQSALLVDGKRATASRLPGAIALIALTTFIILFFYTRSVLIPIKALILNAITMCAVLGAMTWIFQEGHFSGLLGFTPMPLDTSVPVLLFCIAFGLSMDYEIL